MTNAGLHDTGLWDPHVETCDGVCGFIQQIGGGVPWGILYSCYNLINFPLIVFPDTVDTLSWVVFLQMISQSI